MSTPLITIGQEGTEYTSTGLHQITDATEDLNVKKLDWDNVNVEPSSVYRRTSMDFFGGSFAMNDSFFGSMSRRSLSFGVSDSIWSAVNEAKHEQAAPLPLQRNDSLASNFTSMTGDELSDEVEPWAMATDSRFDFGFSSALRDSCVYNMPPEYLPLDEDSDAGYESESETVVDSDTEEEVNDDASEPETVSADELEPMYSVEDDETQAFTSTAEAGSQILPSSLPRDVPDGLVRPTAEFLRRSVRVSRPSQRAISADCQPQTPSKRNAPYLKASGPRLKRLLSSVRRISPLLDPPVKPCSLTRKSLNQ
ncbi:hypothetical protein B0H13DRAFT_829250 [Mycena leptocephala]|nr:hypothetical protein B0H13DRAFT_829250 [Mycena leptocephala]